MAAYTNQPVTFNGHLSICGCLTGLRNKSKQNKPDNFWQWHLGYFIDFQVLRRETNAQNNIHFALNIVQLTQQYVCAIYTTTRNLTITPVYKTVNVWTVYKQ